MSDYKIFCGDNLVASASGPKGMSLVEAFRYARQYREDGRVTIKLGDELVAMFSQVTLCESRLSGLPMPEQEDRGVA